MKKYISPTTLALLAGALFIFTTASLGRAQNLQRFASEFLNFDGTEQHAGPGDTPALDNGVQIWDDHVTVPASVNVLYVTLSATGDTSIPAVESQFSCLSMAYRAMPERLSTPLPPDGLFWKRVCRQQMTTP